MTSRFQTLNTRRLLAIVGLALFLAVATIGLALCVGTQGGFSWPDRTVLGLRADRVLLAAVVGLGLGAAGAAYQGVLRNDLADPYLLGVASGATLGAYIWRLPWLAGVMAAIGPEAALIGQPAFAFVGAFLAAALVLGISGGARARSDPATVVLVGVIVSTLCGALVLLIFTFTRALPGGGSLQSVMVGELQTSLSSAQFWTATAIVLAGFGLLVLRSPHLNIAALGDDEARTLGLRVARERLVMLSVASIVTAAAVSVSGPIGFVGLIAPHVARRTAGVDQRVALPVAGALGAVLLILADAVLRWLLGVGAINTIVPIGVATALLGAPFFLYLLLRHRRTAAGGAA